MWFLKVLSRLCTNFSIALVLIKNNFIEFSLLQRGFTNAIINFFYCYLSAFMYLIEHVGAFSWSKWSGEIKNAWLIERFCLYILTEAQTQQWRRIRTPNWLREFSWKLILVGAKHSEEAFSLNRPLENDKTWKPGIKVASKRKSCS